MAKNSSLSVYDYVDYRRYLSDYYKEQKRRANAFSYRYFSRKAGLNSIGLYKDVIDGRQSLGKSLVRRFSTAIGHNAREAEYFENLVFFNEARSMEERTAHYQRMIASCDSRALKVDADCFEYYSHWYYSAIRALVSYAGFNGDYKKLANALDPPIKIAEARQAIATLERLGFIAPDDDGVYHVSKPSITTGRIGDYSEVNRMQIVAFQKQMMERSKYAYDRNPWSAIDMSTLTLSISPATTPVIKKELAALRKRIARMAEDDPNPSVVYQLNHQFFPLTKVDKNENDDKK